VGTAFLRHGGVGGRRLWPHNVRDFEGVNERFGIRIVTPGDFLTEVRRSR
jgi:hypothetical protein